MTDGKLVRDLIPDIIRRDGREPEIRYLTGDEFADALAAKLREEAAEAAAEIHDRAALIEELADLGEVIAAVMAIRSISRDEVEASALAKARERGRFQDGAWLVANQGSRVDGCTHPA